MLLVPKICGQYVNRLIIFLLYALFCASSQIFGGENLEHGVCGCGGGRCGGGGCSGTAVGIGSNSFIEPNLRAVNSQISVQLNEF